MSWTAAKYAGLAVLALLVATDAPGQVAPAEPLSLPKEVRFAPGKKIVVKPDTSARRVKWITPPGVEVEALENGLRLFVWAAPGKYTLRAQVIVGKSIDDAETVEAECTLVIEGEKPPPPPPPEDVFRKELLTLVAAEPAGPDRPQSLKQLAALYRQAAKLAGDAAVPTAGELVERVRAAGSSLLPPGALVAVRKRTAEELGRSMPSDPDAPLSEPLRLKAADIYGRAAAALEEAAK